MNEDFDVTFEQVALPWEGESIHEDIEAIEDDISGMKQNLVITDSISMGRASDTDVGVASVATGVDVTASGDSSHAEGEHTTASEANAHAEGVNTTAEGYAAHAEGNDSTAHGNASHAEGANALANGNGSHAEGSSTKAYGANSHAEGTNTEAGTSSGSPAGTAAHAEGSGSKATGNYSHAEGSNTVASAANAHAEGLGTISAKGAQHTVGKYNVEDTESGTYGKYAEIVGNGSGNSSRSNARVLEWTGDERLKGELYVQCENNSTGGLKVATLQSPALTGTPTAPTATSGTNTEQIATTAFVQAAFKSADAMIYKGVRAGGDSVANTTYTPNADRGDTYKVSTAGYINTLRVEVGDMLICTEDNTAAATSSNVSTINTKWNFIQANMDTVDATFTNSLTVGTRTITNNKPLGVKSAVVGSNVAASGTNSFAQGAGSTAYGNNSHAEGSSIAGTNSDNTIGNMSHAEGTGTNTTGTAAHSEGELTGASGQAAHAEGYSSVASGAYSHAEGEGTKASKKAQHTAGKWNVEDTNSNTYGLYAEIVGNGTGNAARSNARTLDWDGNEYLKNNLYIRCSANSANGKKVAAEELVLNGVNEYIPATSADFTYGYWYHEEGYAYVHTLTDKYKGAHGIPGAMGVGGDDIYHLPTTSDEDWNVYKFIDLIQEKALKSNPVFSGSLSMNRDTSQGIGEQSATLGMNNAAVGSQSIAEGYTTVALAPRSHAEGYATLASGSESHAEGMATIAESSCSHASGKYNIASAYAEYPYWIRNTAYAVGDHVKRESNDHVITGYECNTANTDALWNAAHWTELGTASTYLESIGNGTDDNARSNARTLDWNGNEVLAGTLTCNTSITIGSTTLTEADLQRLLSITSASGVSF